MTDQAGGKPAPGELPEAVGKNDIKAVKAILRRGADVNEMDSFRRDMLNLAVLRGYKEMALLLIAHGADINARDDDGFTPLMKAARRGHAVMTRFLLDHGAQVDIGSNYGKTALMLAAASQQFGTMSLLIERGADLDARDCDGFTALKWAQSLNWKKVAAFLEEAAANQSHAAATRKQQGLKARARKPVIIRGPKP